MKTTVMMINVKLITVLLMLSTFSSSSTISFASASATVPTTVPATASASASASPGVVVPAEANPNKPNPVFQLLGYVKDSFVRMKDGSVQLYTNHKTCNDIRSKQKEYMQLQQDQLDLQTPPSSTTKPKKLKYKSSLGGITYQEFDFLQRGKEDRSKLANVVFMMVFAPNFVPYAFMFFPEMLPSPFAMPKGGMGFGGGASTSAGVHNKWDLMSRERTHAVLQAMISMEKAARTPPLLSNLNPFGKSKTKKMMEKMDRFNHVCGALLTAEHGHGVKTNNSRNGGGNGNNANGRDLDAELVMKVLEDEIYTEGEPKKDRTALTIVPKAIIQGLGKALDAPGSSVNSNPLMPTFLIRGRVLNSLSQIKDADEFLVNEKVDLRTLTPELLQEACSRRLIGGPGRSVEEMVDGLSVWLDLAVKRPLDVVKSSNSLNGGGLYYNGNLARMALLSYNAIGGARDARSSSFLPRLMYQGPLYNAFGVTTVRGDGPYEMETETPNLPSIVTPDVEQEESKPSSKRGRRFKRK